MYVDVDASKKRNNGQSLVSQSHELLTTGFPDMLWVPKLAGG